MKRQKKNDPGCNWLDRLITLPQYILPQHLLSLMMHALTRSQLVWFKNAFIRFICWWFKVDLNEAASARLQDYPSFNAFFTRPLRAGIRPIAEGDDVVVSPVDGAISQLGAITQGRLIQAKGRDYTVEELLGGDDKLATYFDNGQFATIYLSPRDYHRIHMPLNGSLTKMRYVPGRLFSVNPRTTRAVPRLFARNERVVTIFDTEFGPLVQVLVGAIFVGSMETVWEGQITPPYGNTMREWHYADEQAVYLKKGTEMGRFNMGSTVILLLPPAVKALRSDWRPGQLIRLGQAMN